MVITLIILCAFLLGIIFGAAMMWAELGYQRAMHYYYRHMLIYVEHGFRRPDSMFIDNEK